MHVESPNAYNHYGVFAQTSQMGNANSAESTPMKCSILGCPGEYEPTLIHHTIRQDGQVIVIDHVPAQQCDVCGDVVLDPATIRRIEALLASQPQPHQTAPVFEYA